MVNFSALKAISVFALTVIPSEATFVGQFVADHEITLNGYQNKQACEADEGRWVDHLCYFDVADSIFFSVDPEFGLVAEVSTVGNNGDECNFDGQAQILDGLVATVKDTLQLESGETVTCELAIEAESPRFDRISVSVKTPKECEAFCGGQASLNVRKAVRLESDCR